jgi:hypothetical protein
LVLNPSLFEVEIAFVKSNRCESSGGDQILAELIQAGGKISQLDIHKLSNSVWNKEELPDHWKEYLIVPMHKKYKEYLYHCYQPNTAFSYYPHKVRYIYRIHYWWSSLWVSM